MIAEAPDRVELQPGKAKVHGQAPAKPGPKYMELHGKETRGTEDRRHPRLSSVAGSLTVPLCPQAAACRAPPRLGGASWCRLYREDRGDGRYPAPRVTRPGAPRHWAHHCGHHVTQPGPIPHIPARCVPRPARRMAVALSTSWVYTAARRTSKATPFPSAKNRRGCYPVQVTGSPLSPARL